MAFFTVLHLRHDRASLCEALCFAFGAPLSVQPGAKASHHTDKILDLIFFAVLSPLDDFDWATLHRQQLLDIVEPKMGQAIFVLHYNQDNRRVSQQLEQFWASVVHP